MRIRLVNFLMSYAEDAAKNDETSEAQRSVTPLATRKH